MAEKASGSRAGLIDKPVIPGDVVLDLSDMTNQTIKLRGGLRQYVPCVGDSILGIVADSRVDHFLVDIKGPTLAYLPVLAFEGGTR